MRNRVLSDEKDTKLDGRVYTRRRRRTAVGGARLAEFLFRLIFSLRIKFGGAGQ